MRLSHRHARMFALALVAAGLATSVLILSMNLNRTSNVSAVEMNGVGVYWDGDCRYRVSSIGWGNLTPGSVKNIIVYIRNEAGQPIYLFWSTKNWNPLKAADYLTLKCNFTGTRIDPNVVVRSELRLSVSRNIAGISNFSFDIVITGSSLPGDVDGDGDVDIGDQRLLELAMFTQSGDLDWNPNADIDGDGEVDVGDQRILQVHMFETL